MNYSYYYYEVLGYEIHPLWALEFLQDLWQTQPLGVISIVLTTLGIGLTLSYKILDILWDIYKEKSRQGRLMIELSPEINADDDVQLGELALKATLSNTGKEALVVREIGYWEKRCFGLLGGGFVAVRLSDAGLPRVLQGKELIELHLYQHAPWTQKGQRFCVKDSTGKLWEAPDWQLRRVRRQLNSLARNLEAQKAVQLEPVSV